MSKPMNAASPTTAPASQVPHEKIALRAYEKWCGRGQPRGTDQQDWLEAEAELRTEMSRAGSSMQVNVAGRR